MKNNIIVKKIIGYAEKVIAYTTEISNRENFETDTKTLDACVFNLSQIGELASKIDESYKIAHSDIPWRQIIAVRNRIVLDYEGIDFVLIWDIVKNDLPELVTMLKGL
ncbi:MAG: DUF86 domain-containing protein [Spirochaetia bacterium]|jgi:uncharacterized protein with HEPN domain|nr:DUF86 domain-containing protein [Spirochaetia bacterium]